jgi:hypothetical protein
MSGQSPASCRIPESAMQAKEGSLLSNEVGSRAAAMETGLNASSERQPPTKTIAWPKNHPGFRFPGFLSTRDIVVAQAAQRCIATISGTQILLYYRQLVARA